MLCVVSVSRSGVCFSSFDRTSGCRYLAMSGFIGLIVGWGLIAIVFGGLIFGDRGFTGYIYVIVFLHAWCTCRGCGGPLDSVLVSVYSLGGRCLRGLVFIRADIAASSRTSPSLPRFLTVGKPHLVVVAVQGAHPWDSFRVFANEPAVSDRQPRDR